MLQPRKRLGQNFLRDPNVIRKIVGSLSGEGPIVEIGPGTGALTGLLMEKDPDLTAFEIDDRFVAHLKESHPALDVREQDVLDVDWPAIAAERGGPLRVIGNLPYYITTPILFSLLDAPRGTISEFVVMMQKEVAQRIVAVPRTKAYGILSVVLQKLSRPELLFDVSPNVFYPRPEVTSSVVRFDLNVPELPVADRHFRNVVRMAFGQRRKTLRNSLSGIGAPVPEAYSSLRAEALTPDDFVTLAGYLGPAGTRSS
ncbi:MAG: 16S rRNA (adenine1518-N6/adenine1519-N6)-dimethyltransferase [Rhodothermales bacterium]|jgi:16S rRNA (adenine1518-N6/adenine1519-N6)-dimethyltransferase